MGMQTRSTSSTSPGVSPHESQVAAGPLRGLRYVAANVLETAVGLLEEVGRAARDSLREAVAALRGEGAGAGAIDQENNVGRPSGTQTGDQTIQEIEINAYNRMIDNFKGRLMTTVRELRELGDERGSSEKVNQGLVNYLSTCSERLQNVFSMVQYFASNELTEGEGGSRLQEASEVIVYDENLRFPINEFRGEIIKIQRSFYMSEGRVPMNDLRDFCRRYERVFEEVLDHLTENYQRPISDVLEKGVTIHPYLLKSPPATPWGWRTLAAGGNV